MKKRDIREGAWKTEGIDLNIKDVYKRQGFIPEGCVSVLLCLVFPKGD